VSLPGAGWFGGYLEVGDQADVVGGPHASGWLIEGEKASTTSRAGPLGPRTAP
jgi:hypothetical protein